MRRFFAIAIVVATVAGGLGIAPAQRSYPTRTVRLILPFGAASATDITARLFADRLSTDPAGDIKPLAAVKFAPDPDVKCLLSAVETGDPKTGRSTFILKAPSGCVVPWHSHTAEEQLIVITGNVLSEMLDHKAARLGPGGFAVMGSRMPHQFTCLARPECVMIVAFDGPYDIFWGQGR